MYCQENSSTDTLRLSKF